MNRMQVNFEQWVITNKGETFLSENDHPSLWKGSDDEIEAWNACPYSHPWTAGAYEAWKFIYPYMGGPR